MLFAQLSMSCHQNRKKHACWKCSCMGLTSHLDQQSRHIQVHLCISCILALNNIASLI